MLRSLSLALLTASIVAQGPSVVHYGASCPIAGGSLVTQGSPVLGGTFSVLQGNHGGMGTPPFYVRNFVVLGLSPTSMPLTLPGLTAGNGCLLLATPDVVVANDYGAVSIPIPAAGAFVGVRFFVQGVSFVRGGPANVNEVRFSDGVQCTIG